MCDKHINGYLQKPTISFIKIWRGRLFCEDVYSIVNIENCEVEIFPRYYNHYTLGHWMLSSIHCHSK